MSAIDPQLCNPEIDDVKTTRGARLSEAVARPVRGVAQGGVSFIVVDVIEAFEVYDFTDRQYGLAIIVFGAAISALQNLGENKGWWKPFLRQVPPKAVSV